MVALAQMLNSQNLLADDTPKSTSPLAVPDIHATILHLLGLDHTKLTYQHNGRRYRLTDVSGNAIKKILA